MTSSEDFQSPYPPPPLFYKLYTKENLARGTEGKAFELEGLVLPSLDPPPPISGEYECFGIKTSRDVPLRKLSDFLIPELVPMPLVFGPGMKGVLNKLNDSLLLNFVELLELLIANPVEAANKVQELRSILINFHHVLNAYREHEAREELVYLLTKQAQERQDVLVKLHSAQRDVQRKQK